MSVSSDLRHTHTQIFTKTNTNIPFSRQVFLDPLQNNGILSKQDIQLLFSNLDEILQVNNAILARLEQRLNEAGSTSNMEVGDIFLEVVRIASSFLPSLCLSFSFILFFFSQKLKVFQSFNIFPLHKMNDTLHCFV